MHSSTMMFILMKLQVTSRLEIRHFGKTNACIMTMQTCTAYIMFPTKRSFRQMQIEREREREREKERNRQTDRQSDRHREAQKDRQKNRQRQNDRQTDEQRKREREGLGKSLLCLRIIMLKCKKTSCFTQTLQFENVSQISFSFGQF